MSLSNDMTVPLATNTTETVPLAKNTTEKVPLAKITPTITPAAMTTAQRYSASAQQSTTEANRYSNFATGLQIFGAGLNVLSTYANRQNVRSQNKQLSLQAQMLDVNTKNREAQLYENFRKGIEDLKVVSAAKNVDYRSQAVQADIVSSGYQMGLDIQTEYQQNELQKSAIRLQQKVNKANQRASETQSWINFTATSALLFI